MQSRYFKRKLAQKAAFALSILSAAAGMTVLFLILGYVVKKGATGLNLDFFIKTATPVGVPGGGMAHALLGSLYMVGLAGLFAIPVGLLVAVYLSEYGKGPFASFVRFMSEALIGVPSIVVGLFAYTVLVFPLKRFSALAGAFALAFMMLPILIKSAEELLRLVPQHLREASLALGIPKWKTIIRVVLKTALPGIVTAVMLSVARVAGEAAPLLFTALGNSYLNLRLDQPMASLPVQIYAYAISPYEDWHQKAWTAALVLILFVLCANLIGKLYARKYRY
ncbi:MAG: phosphate ABC transporter permease PstA [Candidatus Omnitrophota bacterium]